MKNFTDTDGLAYPNGKEATMTSLTDSPDDSLKNFLNKGSRDGIIPVPVVSGFKPSRDGVVSPESQKEKTNSPFSL